VCTTLGNLNNRRVLYGENPQQAQFIGNLDRFDDLTSMDYRGLKLSVQRRAASGVSVNGNWTWGRCVGLPIFRGGAGGSDVFGGGAPYANPDDLEYDRGHCDWHRAHLTNFTIGYQTPSFDSAVLRALASDWRVSGIVNARSGNRLTISTGVTSFNGIGTLRVDQVSDDVYGEKTLNSYLNRAAFAPPAPGAFGNFVRNSISGPGFWKADLAVSRLFSLRAARQVEVRMEAFNLFNTFNWGDPIVNWGAGNFGRIQTMAGDPRILQFGIKYGF
jgi:hypothetical protein